MTLKGKGRPALPTVLLAGFYLTSFVLVLRAYFWLPGVTPHAEHYEDFSAERALRHLNALTKLGPRTVGNFANEILAPHYLLNELHKLQAEEAEAAKDGSQDHWHLEIDVQHPSGAFPTSFLGGFLNTYQTVTNVLVRLSSSSAPAAAAAHSNALLVNAHYDSAIGTPAAADDAVNVAVMLELLRLLLHRPRHGQSADLIFLFNGAEETNWQAAHGFITQHPWAPSVRAVVNLEACGAGGRDLVIQTGSGDSWIALLYARHAPHPRAFTLAQDIFRSRIAGETDFQTFRDYGDVEGIDFANIEDGYVYHNARDTPDRIPAASVQRLGENVLAMVETISTHPSLLVPDPPAVEHGVYFDVLGMFMVLYATSTADLLNCASLLLVPALIVAAGMPLGSVLAAAGLGLQSLFLGLISSVSVAVVLALTKPMVWYKSPALAFFLFTCPALIGNLVARLRYQRKAVATGLVSFARVEEHVLSGALLLWCCLLLPAQWKQVGSAYLPMLWTGPVALLRLVPVLLPELFPGKTRAFSPAFLSLHLLAIALPGLLTVQYSVTLFDFVTPLTGRIGTQVPADVLMAVAASIVVWTLSQVPFSVLHLRPPQVFERLTAIVGFVFLLACAAALFMSPFDRFHPKRLYVQHTLRQFGDGTTDTFLWGNTMDFTGMDMLRSEIPAFKDAPVLPREGLYGAAPWYFPIIDMVQGGLAAPAAAPMLPHGVPFTSVTSTKDEVSEGVRTISIVAKGPDHLTLALELVGGGDILEWSFADGKPSDVKRADCDCYYIFHSGGKDSSLSTLVQDPGQNMEWSNGRSVQGKQEYVLEFWIKVPADKQVQVAAWGQYLDVKTPELIALESSLPDWVDPISFVSLWTNQTF